jgi:hypothetical protein
MGRLGCAVVVALGAAGCGDDSGPQDVVLTQAQAQAAGQDIAAQVTALSADFTLTGVGEFPAKAVGRVPLDPQVRRLLVAGLRTGLTAECAALSDTTDSDADGVPNDLTISFSSPACTTMTDSATVILSGSVRVSDPGQDPGFDIAYSNVRLRVVAATSTDFAEARLNGTQGIGATTTSATLNENLTLAIVLRHGAQTANITMQDSWNATFQAAQGQTYDVNAPLPDGTLSLTGNTNWAFNARNFAFGLSTTSPLVYDAQCGLEPPFTAGELRALVVGNRGGAFVRVVFPGCGVQPIVTLVGQPAS